MKECEYYLKFDGHYTPECVEDHNHRLNGRAKPENFSYCPFCGGDIYVMIVDIQTGDYSRPKKGKKD